MPRSEGKQSVSNLEANALAAFDRRLTLSCTYTDDDLGIPRVLLDGLLADEVHLGECAREGVGEALALVRVLNLLRRVLILLRFASHVAI